MVLNSIFAESLERLLLEADKHSRCHRLPMTGGAEMPHPFCNAPPVQGRPYCERHCAVAFTRSLGPAGSVRA
jgi:hypothetical protein